MAPEAGLLVPIERLCAFMRTLDDAALDGVFASRGVTILENFAPHVFKGRGAVRRWAEGFKAHAQGLGELRHNFGPAQDVTRHGDLAYLSLPTTWRGLSGGEPFIETGGWAFVLRREGEAWRILSYGWAVTSWRIEKTD